MSKTVVVYMYRGNGYKTYQRALQKKSQDKDRTYSDVPVTPLAVRVDWKEMEREG